MLYSNFLTPNRRQGTTCFRGKRQPLHKHSGATEQEDLQPLPSGCRPCPPAPRSAPRSRTARTRASRRSLPLPAARRRMPAPTRRPFAALRPPPPRRGEGGASGAPGPWPARSKRAAAEPGPEAQRSSGGRSWARRGGRRAAAPRTLWPRRASRRLRALVLGYRGQGERQTKCQTSPSVCASLILWFFFLQLFRKKIYCVFGNLCGVWSSFRHTPDKQRKRGRGTAFRRRHAFSQEEVDCVHDKSPPHLL